jgi:hypothetical protein
MDPTAILTRRFPLTPRPRPPCTPLSQRVAAITQLAATSLRDHDATMAAAVFNQSALLAADCGLHDLARDWCHRHARIWLDNLPLDASNARHALEPLVNLARLETREGRGSSAFLMLDTLYRAVATRATATVAGVILPGAHLTAASNDHHELRRWLWTVHLSDGTRALTSVGRWHDALAHLQRHHGIGNHMLDGRQVAVIAHTLGGDTRTAVQLIRHTSTGQPWEQAVTACLAVLCRHQEPADITVMVDTYRQVVPADHPPIFYVRLGVTLLEAATEAGHQCPQSVAQSVIKYALDSSDGYAAREIEGHPGCAATLTPLQEQRLATIRDGAALGQQRLDSAYLAALSSDLDRSGNVIATVCHNQARTVGARARTP